MIGIIDELKTGNHQIVNFFVEAENLWKGILINIDSIEVTDLADTLSKSQYKFEGACNRNRRLGKRVMAWSGFAHFYTCQNGFDDNGARAFKLAQAFSKSSCSLEVKGAARNAALHYSVNDYA
jgi:hypothetical protein